MKELIDGLNNRLEIALKSKTEREFYQSLYHYYDFVYKTPALRKILDKSEKEYSHEFGNIWDDKDKKYTEEELVIKRAEVYKLERFNLFALGCGILMRIYLPIDDYRNTNAPDNKQDPVAVILMKGVDYAIKLKKWEKDELKSYNRWFEGERNMYEAELRQFHLMFLEELSKIKKIAIGDKVNDFVFDHSTGYFEYWKNKGTMSPKSREYRFLNALYSSSLKQATYGELLGLDKDASSSDRIMLAEVVKVVKRKLGIGTKDKKGNPNIIKNISKYGYKLDI